MEAIFPLFFAAVTGFSHAFEADHLVAVSNIVTRRDRLLLAIKDGMYWGLGHSSTILAIGFLVIVAKATFFDGYFGYLEALVGGMLIALGVYRARQIRGRHPRHMHDPDGGHRLAYGVGLIHGLAGSGAMVLIVMTEVSGAWNSLFYLLVFGLGSVVGMLLAAGIFSLPFGKTVSSKPVVQQALTLLSSLLCIGYGSYVVYENLFAA
jgi:hypothetical protein